MTQVCRICATGNGHQTFRFRERMFGWGDEFGYFLCRQCGCLQIEQVPADLGRFYPPHYYSFHLQPVPQRGLKSWLAAKRDFSSASGIGLLGRLLALRVPARTEVACLGQVPLRREMRILDVGCGRGQLLSILHRAGFRHLLGVDPYLSAEVQVADGVRVLNCPVQSVEGQFDCIMLHHVFEHLENGLEMLIRCRERLAPGGKLLLRFPTVECDAWERYGEHWVALDAPRHLLLPTRRSLEILVPQAGLRMVECWCDSTAFQFVGSELYLQGLPLADAQGRPTPITDHFTAKQLKHFERQAQSLNASNRGDQLAVLLEV